ncbi:MAG: ATP-binding protein, partial [Candidatus Stygibacter australis]|nr:ATP-binding protein [Candidatus Stygibacter australis]
TRYIAYMGHFPHQDIKGTLFMLTIKVTMDNIIKNELEMASPGVILDRLVSILGTDNITDSMELLVCLIDSDFEFVRYAKIGSVNILQYDLASNSFCDLEKAQISLNSDSTDELEKPKSSFEEQEFSFNDQKLNIIYTCELQNYSLNEKKLGLDGIKRIISEIDDPNSFLMPYIFNEKLLKEGYTSITSDFSFVLFRTNNLMQNVDNRFLVTFKSVLTNTSHIRRQCEKFILDNTGQDDLAFEVELVIAEILTNVIVHGLKNKPDTMVVLSLVITDNVIISIWDKGIEWIIPILKKEDAFDLVANDATSGRGLPIIVTLSDEITRKRIDSINQTRIIFTIDSDKESLC